MPAYYTHLYFALQLIDKLPYAPNAVIRLYPDAYRLGALGADILRPMGRTSAELDVAKPFDLFEQSAAHIYESGSKCQLSYMLGMLTHYLLDSRINPYMYYFAERGVPHYFDEGREIVSYDNIKQSIDHHIAHAYLDGQTDALQQEKARTDVIEDIGKLYERAICRVVGHILPAKQIDKLLEQHEWTPSEGYKLPDLDYTNRNHHEWETVRNGNWKTRMSLEELMSKLESIAIKLMRDYMARVRSGDALKEDAFRVNHLGVLL